MRILVTGAAGMLGTDVVKVLEPKHDVIALDHVACDITDDVSVGQLLDRRRPDLIVNCAAFPDVDGCEKYPERAFAVNGRGPGNLARAAEAVGARLFHISTDFVFDGRKRTPYTEDDPSCPISVYGKSKLEGERLILEGSGASRHLILRTSWLYGMSKPNFIEKTLSAAETNDRLVIVADQVSCPTWTYHLARKIAELVGTPASGILHLAGSGQCTRQEMAAYIVRRLPVPIEIAPTTWAALHLPAQRPAYSAMVSRRLESLDLDPLPDWKAAIDEYFLAREAAKVAVKAT
jgi:dTDP-4-dehydrorhamnose reductase